MELVTDTFQNTSVENVLTYITEIRKKHNYEHYFAIIYRRISYLGKSISADIYLSNDESDFMSVIDFYNKELIDYYPCSAIFKDNLLFGGNNEYILFKRNCTKCLHKCKLSNTKENYCDVFKCDPQYVTYICFSKAE